MFDKYIKYALRFESLFSGNKVESKFNLKNPIPCLLALHSSTDIFLLVHHIIKIEEKNHVLHVYGQKLAKDIYLLSISTYIKAFLLFIELIIN